MPTTSLTMKQQQVLCIFGLFFMAFPYTDSLRKSACYPDQFACVRARGCISSTSFCDEEVDCNDASDERKFNHTIHTSKDGIPCRGIRYKNNICLLPASQAHKNKSLCSPDATCTDDEFECMDGSECLHASFFCIGRAICRDGSDEYRYDNSTTGDSIPCISKNNKNDICSLPANQAHKNQTICRADAECKRGEFECLDKTACIESKDFCNQYGGCSDRSHVIEYNRSIHSSKDGIKCLGYGKSCLLPNRHVCDGAIHCYDGSDECLCGVNGSYIDEDCFGCLDGTQRISTAKVCDGIVNCGDMSDECLCMNIPNKPVVAVCNQVNWDSQPYSGAFSCKNGSSFTNLTVGNICDGSVECGDGEDEKVCETKAYECAGGYTDPEYADCTYRCKYGSKAKMCDGIFSCREMSDECDVCEDPPSICNNERSYDGAFTCPQPPGSDPNIKPSLQANFLCNGVPDCPGGEDEMGCPFKFYCADSTTHHIPEKKKCDLKEDCKDSSDELECRNSTNEECKAGDANKTANCYLTHFYCDDSGDVLYIDRQKQVCDGNKDCQSGVDECQTCTQDFFSNDDSLISSRPIIPFLYIISISAVAGNMFVLYSSFSELIRERKKLNNNEKLQRILVLNLSAADFLTGVYTLAMCILNEVLSTNRYCLNDHNWRSGLGCSLLGACMVVGSEASVFSLTIITAVRVQAIGRPIQRISIRLIVTFLTIGWLISVALAVCPLLPPTNEYFVQSIWYKANLFGTKVEHKDLRNFSVRMMTQLRTPSNFTEIHGEIGSWSLFEALMKKINPEYIVSRRFGYYSTHGVCLPRLFPKRDDTSWGFSLSIILINFFAFLFILIGYTIIYKKATKHNISEQAATRGVKLQRKLTIIVFTDFCCWMPICVMAFMQLNGKDIPKQVYVPAGTILIPINSAINPLLYSKAVDWLKDKLTPSFSRLRANFTDTRLIGLQTNERDTGKFTMKASGEIHRRKMNRPIARVEPVVMETHLDQEHQRSTEVNSPSTTQVMISVTGDKKSSSYADESTV